MKFLITSLVLIISLISIESFAKAKYGKAGCGLGSVLIGPDGNQVLALTTNDLSTQTSSITSGTSNCVAPTSNEELAINFIEGNYNEIAKDAAMGRGETLTHLAYIYQLNDDDRFAEKIKANYSNIFSKKLSPLETHERIAGIL